MAWASAKAAMVKLLLSGVWWHPHASPEMPWISQRTFVDWLAPLAFARAMKSSRSFMFTEIAPLLSKKSSVVVRDLVGVVVVHTVQHQSECTVDVGRFGQLLANHRWIVAIPKPCPVPVAGKVEIVAGV